MVLHDQHIHSSYSMDSNQNIKEYYELCKSLGCSYFVTTEHLDLDTTYTKNDWVVDYDSLLKDYASFEDKDGPKCLLGIEVGYRKDHIDELKSWVKKYDFDVVNLSIHDSGKIEYYYEQYFNEYGIKETLNIYFEQMLDAVKHFKDYNVLSHIDYGFKTAYNMDPTIDMMEYKPIIKKIFEIIIGDNKALELNTKVLRVLTKKHLDNLLDLYISMGGTKFTLSSDAHSINRYKNGFDDIINTLKEHNVKYLCYYVKRKEYHYDI